VAITVWSVRIMAILYVAYFANSACALPHAPCTNASKPNTTTRTRHVAAGAAEATTPALMLDLQVAVMPVIESDKTVPKELQKDLYVLNITVRRNRHEFPHVFHNL
jgi:hypothetical protein